MPWPRRHELEHNEVAGCSFGDGGGGGGAHASSSSAIIARGFHPAIELHRTASAVLRGNVVRGNGGAAVGRQPQTREEAEKEVVAAKHEATGGMTGRDLALTRTVVGEVSIRREEACYPSFLPYFSSA